MSDYAYFEDNYRLIAIDLSKQKALDADPRAIQQIAFQGVAGGDHNTKIRLYTILEQSKETVLEFYKGTLDRQLKQLKTAVKDKTGATLRMSFKMFDGNDLPHELLLTTRQKEKQRNAFNKNMSTDLTLSKT